MSTSHYIFRWIWFCFWVSTTWGIAGSQSHVLHVEEEQPFTSLSGYVETCEDPEGQFTYASMGFQNWQKHKGRLEFGQTSSVWWFRFTLQNSSSDTIKLHLDIGFPQLDDIQVFIPGSENPILLGDNYPYDHRLVDVRPLVVPIKVAPGQSIYYLRIQSTSHFSVPLSIISPDKDMERISEEQSIIGMFYGLALALILYNFVLFIGSKERAYGIFVICCISMAGMASAFDGTGFSIWRNQLYWQDRAIFFFVASTMFSLFLFARDYLDLNQSGTFLERFLLVASRIWAVLAIAALFLPVPLSVKIYAPLALIGFLIVGTIAAIRLKQGNIIAGYFLSAVFTLILLGVLTALAALGIIGGFHVLSFFGMKIAIAAMMLLLSFGQAHRIKRLRELRSQMAEKLVHARAESEAKTSFLAKMSHELRTPMNAVLGIVELMKDTPLDKQQKSHLTVVESAGRSLLSVIDDVLDYARLQTDKVTLHLEPFDIFQLLSECHQMIQRGNRKTGLEVIYQWAPQTPQYVVGDPSRLRQVVLNLLGNACKFTEKGQVTLRALPGKKTLEFQEVIIEVEDSGIGISSDAVEQLFQPFAQADTSTSRDYGGTGLGLSISKQLVELMGGQIHVVSELDKGSLFRFSIQVRLAPKPCKNKEEHRTKRPQYPQLQILVAEDNAVNRKVAKGFLARLGINPVFAINGREAYETYCARPDEWDLVFMDCEMPEMDGFQATEAIRAAEKEQSLRTVPIVGLSAHALPEHRERGLASGMQEYLHKPLIFEELMSALERFAP